MATNGVDAGSTGEAAPGTERAPLPASTPVAEPAPAAPAAPAPAPATAPATAPTPSPHQLAAKLSYLASTYTPPTDPYSQPPEKLEMLSLVKSIQTSLMDAGNMVQQHSLQMAEMVCVRTLLGLKVFDKIPDEGSVGLSKLAADTNVEENLLDRLLRVLAGSGFIVQNTQTGEYSHTKFSKAYCSSPAGMFFTLMHDEFLAPMTEMPKYVKVNGAKEPTSLYKNPYSDYFGASDQGLTTWDIMSRDPERIEVFQRGLGIADSMVPTTGYFDFERFKSVDGEGEQEGGRMEIVDIGGGVGNKMKLILEASPGLKPERNMVQDQKNIIELASGKDRVLPPGVQLLVNDFWKGQPVKGAKAYFIRRVLHDYSDEACVRILEHVKNAMADDSRLLIAEQILPSIINHPELEANVAVLDVATMVMGGKERTEENFKQILDQSGLELIKIWRAPSAPAGVVEAKKKGT